MEATNNKIYYNVGKNLSQKTSNREELKKLSREVSNYLMYAATDEKAKINLFTTIMEFLALRSISIPNGFVEGIMQTDERELTLNVGLFIEGLSSVKI
ncbi:TPA: hypothetical protein KQG29_001492 [Clostridioides difficile]|nr:hypothetical protein [Clostridioides difficile]